MAVTGQENSRENGLLQGMGKVWEFHFESGKIDIFERSRGKSKILSKYGVVHLAIAIFITMDKAWNVCSNGVGTLVNKIWKNMAGKMLKGMTSLFGIIWKRLVNCMGET